MLREKTTLYKQFKISVLVTELKAIQAQFNYVISIRNRDII